MRGFLLGIMVTLLVLVIGVAWYAKTGRVNFEADHPPSGLETRFAMSAVDAATDHRAPDVKNPLPATDENLVAGAHVYLDHCAGCHGTPSNPDGQFASSFNPPVPQFFRNAPDMPDNKNFYVVQHGIRWSGMPAWNKILSEQQMWQVVTFMSRTENLPPAAKAVLNQTSQPPPGRPSR